MALTANATTVKTLSGVGVLVTTARVGLGVAVQTPVGSGVGVPCRKTSAVATAAIHSAVAVLRATGVLVTTTGGVAVTASVGHGVGVPMAVA